MVGSIILAPARDGTSFGFNDVRVGVQGRESFVLADAEGHLRQPQTPKTVLVPGRDSARVPEQWVIRLGEAGWTAHALARGDHEYPELNG